MKKTITAHPSWVLWLIAVHSSHPKLVWWPMVEVNNVDCDNLNVSIESQIDFVDNYQKDSPQV